MSETSKNEHKRHIISPLITKLLCLKTPEDGIRLNSSQAVRKVDFYSSYAIVPTHESEREFVLIDGGKDTNASRLRQFLENRNLGLTAIQALYLTHGHSDHTGAARILPPSVPVYVSAGDNRMLSGELTEGPLPSLFDKLSHKALSAIPGLAPEIIHEDETHVYGDVRITSLAMPGHTTGSTSYFVDGYRQTGSLDWFVGDALDTKRNGEITNAAPPFSHNLQISALSIGRAVQYIRSNNLDISQIMPGHTGLAQFEAVERFVDRQAA